MAPRSRPAFMTDRDTSSRDTVKQTAKPAKPASSTRTAARVPTPTAKPNRSTPSKAPVPSARPSASSASPKTYQTHNAPKASTRQSSKSVYQTHNAPRAHPTTLDTSNHSLSSPSVGKANGGLIQSMKMDTGKYVNNKNGIIKRVRSFFGTDR